MAENKSNKPTLILDRTGPYPAFCPDCGSRSAVSRLTHEPEIASTTCLECGTEVKIEIIRREFQTGNLLQTIDDGRRNNKMRDLTMWSARIGDPQDIELTVKR